MIKKSQIGLKIKNTDFKLHEMQRGGEEDHDMRARGHMERNRDFGSREYCNYTVFVKHILY